MEKSKRRRLFYFLIIAFIIAAPALIAYSLGYTFNIPRREVEQRGGIFVKSRLARLSLFLDNNFVKETPLLAGGALLTGVNPGTHILRVEKEGYTPWVKPVAVKPALVTELRNIILIPEKPKPAASMPEEILRITALRSAELERENTEATTSRGVLKINASGALVEEAGTTTKQLASNAHSFTRSDDTIYFVDNSGFLADYSISENRVNILAHPGFFLGKKPLRFIFTPEEHLIILDGAGGFYLLNSQSEVIKTVEGNIREVRFDNRGEKALLLKEREIAVLWLRNNPYQPFQKEKTVEKIITLNAPLLDARWLFLDDAHVVIRTAGGVFMTELDGRGGRNTVELISGAINEIFTAQEIPNVVFFKKGKAWFKIEL